MLSGRERFSRFVEGSLDGAGGPRHCAVGLAAPLFLCICEEWLLSVKFNFLFSIFSTVWMLLSTTCETSLCLLASVIKTYPMPRVQPVLKAGWGQLGSPHPAMVPSGYQGGRASPPLTRPWGEGLGLGWVGWVTPRLNIPRAECPLLWVPPPFGISLQLK